MYLRPDNTSHGCCIRGNVHKSCKSPPGTLTKDYCRNVCNTQFACVGYYYNPRYTATDSNSCWIATKATWNNKTTCPEGFTLVAGETDIESGNKLEFDGNCLSTAMTGCYIKKTKQEPISKHIFAIF